MKSISTGSDHGLPPVRHQAITRLQIDLFSAIADRDDVSSVFMKQISNNLTFEYVILCSHATSWVSSCFFLDTYNNLYCWKLSLKEVNHVAGIVFAFPLSIVNPWLCEIILVNIPLCLYLLWLRNIKIIKVAAIFLVKERDLFTLLGKTITFYWTRSICNYVTYFWHLLAQTLLKISCENQIHQIQMQSIDYSKY